jgi:hypothetical protein
MCTNGQLDTANFFSAAGKGYESQSLLPGLQNCLLPPRFSETERLVGTGGVSLAFPSDSQFELKVSPFPYGPLYSPDTCASDNNLSFPLHEILKKLGLVLAPERTYIKILIQIELKFE